MTRVRRTAEQWSAILASEKESGSTPNRLARRLNCTINTIRRAEVATGIFLRRAYPTIIADEEWRPTIHAAKSASMSAPELAKSLGVPVSLVYAAERRIGVILRRTQ